MPDEYRENERLARALRLLLDAETGEDSMICHDGGFRYSGDFMSMEAGIVESATLVGGDDLRELLRRGFVEDTDGEAALRVTETGRRFATGESRRPGR